MIPSAVEEFDPCRMRAGGRGIQVGTEAHVGNCYGNARRVVVVSLDAGGRDWRPEDIEGRTESIENVRSADGANQHMQGTFEFLSALLDDQIGEASPMPYFAMLNSAKCRATDGTMNQFPPAIHRNCLPFAEQELEILQPEIVWLQGAIPRNYFWNKTESLDLNSETIRAAIDPASEASADRFQGNALKRIGILTSCSHRPFVVVTPHTSARYGLWTRFKNTELGPVAKILKTIVPSLAS